MTARPLLLVLALALPGAALSQVPPNQLPPTVRKALTALDGDCRGFGGRPGRSPDLMKAADINGDGIRDFVVDMNNYLCDGAGPAMGGGQQGAGLTIYVGGPSNSAIQVYSDTVYGSKIETAGGRSRLWVDVAAASCGQRNAVNIPFSRWEYCSRELVWVPAKQTFAYGPLAQKRRIR